MLLNTYSFLEWSLQHRERSVLIVNGESKPQITICIHRSSFHRKSWVSKSTHHDDDIIKLLCMNEETIIPSEKFIQQTEMDMLFTASSSNLLNVLADIPSISENVREELATDAMVAIRELIKEKATTLVHTSLVFYIKVRIDTIVCLMPKDPKDQKLIQDYEIGICGRRVKNYEEEECPICLQEYLQSSKEDQMIMLCSHLFHVGCLSSWLWGHCLSCPICRFQMPMPPLAFQDLDAKLQNNNWVKVDDTSWESYVDSTDV